MRPPVAFMRLAPAVAVLAMVAVLAPATLASRVRPVNLEEMTDRAGRIVQGDCTAVEIVHDPELGVDVARVSLRVERSLKGEAAETLTFRMLTEATGLPRFVEGERVILFLYGETESGLTSPVGLGQGKFTIVEDKQGGEVALNGFGNRMLFQRLSSDALTRMGEQPARWQGRDGMPPSVLLDLVESLAR